VNGLKAIDTAYNGNFFRSRLEARWAVFFDALGVPYEYEAEGYDLPEGQRYLPDFWLPRESFFIEVKPHEPSVVEVAKARALVKASGKRLAFAVGVPTEDFSPTLVIFPSTADSQRPFEYHGVLRNCVACGRLDVGGAASQEDACRAGCAAITRAYRLPQWQQAVDRAQRARFEHGAVPFHTPIPMDTVAESPAARVYLAGKMGGGKYGNGWRGLIHTDDEIEIGSPFVWGEPLIYGGPNLEWNHGRGVEGLNGSITKDCFEPLSLCDAVFAWIDDTTAYGTFAELGYASALGKHIFVSFSSEYPTEDDRHNLSDELWFIRDMATEWAVVPTPQLGWLCFRAFLASAKRR
jgi:hypothetical protein